MLFERYKCIYCGEPGLELDHFQPWSYTHSASAKRNYNHDEVIPCCRECNSRKRALVFDTIGEVCEYLEGLYRRKYGEDLDVKWTRVEAREELTGRLMREVLASIRRRDRIRRRLDHLQLVREMNPTIRQVWGDLEVGAVGQNDARVENGRRGSGIALSMR